jgi:hypothetical protein
VPSLWAGSSSEDSAPTKAGYVPELELREEWLSTSSGTEGSKEERSLPYNFRHVLSAAGRVGNEIHASVSMVFNPLMGGSKKDVRERYRDPTVADDLNLAPRSPQRTGSPVNYFADTSNVIEQDRLPSPVSSVRSATPGAPTRLSSRLDFEEAGARISQAFVAVEPSDGIHGSRIFRFDPPPQLVGPVFHHKTEPKADLVYNNFGHGDDDTFSRAGGGSFVSMSSQEGPVTWSRSQSSPSLAGKRPIDYYM